MNIIFSGKPCSKACLSSSTQFWRHYALVCIMRIINEARRGLVFIDIVPRRTCIYLLHALMHEDVVRLILSLYARIGRVMQWLELFGSIESEVN